MTRYSKISLGDTTTITHIISDIDVKRFVELSGDNNQLHVSEDFARKTSFKKPVVHGKIGASFISTIIGTKLPGDGALWYSQNLEFLLPVRIGDKLEIQATVTKKNDRNNSIEITTDIYNQHAQRVTAGIAQVKIIEDEVTVENTNAENKKVVLILGATGGIGSQVARQLALEGYDIILHYNANKSVAVELKNELRGITDKKIIVVRANLLDSEEVKEMLFETSRYFQSISALVNASTLGFAPIKLSDLKWKNILSQLEVNVKSNLDLIQNTLPFFEESHYGKIVLITSMYTEQATSELAHYITAKHALNGFAKGLAVDLASRGVRINLVSPGMTNTALISDVPEKVKLVTAARTPLKRLAEPKDVADAVSFLVSEKSDFLTGETIRVNGGQVMW